VHTHKRREDAAKLGQGQVELAKSIALIECRRREINIEITAIPRGTDPYIETGYCMGECVAKEALVAWRKNGTCPDNIKYML